MVGPTQERQVSAKHKVQITLMMHSLSRNISYNSEDARPCLRQAGLSPCFSSPSAPQSLQPSGPPQLPWIRRFPMITPIAITKMKAPKAPKVIKKISICSYPLLGIFLLNSGVAFSKNPSAPLTINKTGSRSRSASWYPFCGPSTMKAVIVTVVPPDLTS